MGGIRRPREGIVTEEPPDTSELSASSPWRRALRYAPLAAAVLIAAIAGGWLLLSGGSSPKSPQDTVRDYYGAIARGGPAAADPLLIADERDDPARAQLPFAGSLDTTLNPDQRPVIAGLQTDIVNQRQDWATVRARGTVDVGRGPQQFDQIVYLQKSGSAWFISTESAVSRSVSTPGATSRSDNALGVLDPQRPREGQPAPDFALADARDGTIRKLSDFRGKAVVLNWYASWCGPCRQEIPDFQQAYSTLGDQVVVLGVDFQETQDHALAILDVFRAKYPALLDREGDVGDHYRVGGLPATFFIDKDGILRVAHIGRVTRDDLQASLAKVGVTYTPPP